MEFGKKRTQTHKVVQNLIDLRSDSSQEGFTFETELSKIDEKDEQSANQMQECLQQDLFQNPSKRQHHSTLYHPRKTNELDHNFEARTENEERIMLRKDWINDRDQNVREKQSLTTYRLYLLTCILKHTFSIKKSYQISVHVTKHENGKVELFQEPILVDVNLPEHYQFILKVQHTEKVSQLKIQIRVFEVQKANDDADLKLAVIESEYIPIVNFSNKNDLLQPKQKREQDPELLYEIDDGMVDLNQQEVNDGLKDQFFSGDIQHQEILKKCSQRSTQWYLLQETNMQDHWQAFIEPLYPPKVLSLKQKDNFQQVLNSKKGFFKLQIDLNSLQKCNRNSGVKNLLDDLSFDCFYRIKFSVTDLFGHENFPCILQQQGSRHSYTNLYTTSVIQLGKKDNLPRFELVNIDLDKLKFNTKKELDENLRLKFQIQVYHKEVRFTKPEGCLNNFSNQFMNSNPNENHLFFKTTGKIMILNFKEFDANNPVVDTTASSEETYYRLKIQCYFNSINLSNHPLMQALRSLSDAEDPPGSGYYQAHNYMKKLFSKIKQKRKKGNEKVARQMEKCIIVNYDKIFATFFDCLGKENFAEHQNCIQIRKIAFKVLHNMIYIFKGEPPQLLQMHESYLNSYPDHSQLINKFLQNYFSNKKSNTLMTFVGRRMMDYFNECHLKLEKLCEINRFPDSSTGKKVFQLVRILPTLMEIARFSQVNYDQYVQKNKLPDLIFNIVRSCRQLENNPNYLAIPCIFILQLQQFYEQFENIHRGKEIFKELFGKFIFQEIQKDGKYGNKKYCSFVLEKFLKQTKVPLVNDYEHFKGMPQIILANQIKLTPKIFQFLKIVQIKGLLERIKDPKFMHTTFIEAQKHYREFLKSRSFHDRLFEDQIFENISDFTKTESLIPMLVKYFILDGLSFPQGHFQNLSADYFGNLKKEEFVDQRQNYVEMQLETMHNFISFLQDFPKLFYPEQSEQQTGSNQAEKASQQMRMWGLLLDLNLVSQEPINFTAGSFEASTHHIFHFFFSTLEATVDNLNDSEKACTQTWFLRQLTNNCSYASIRTFYKFLKSINTLLKEALSLYLKGRIHQNSQVIQLKDLLHFIRQAVYLTSSLFTHIDVLVSEHQLEFQGTVPVWQISIIHYQIVSMLRIIGKKHQAEGAKEMTLIEMAQANEIHAEMVERWEKKLRYQFLEITRNHAYVNIYRGECELCKDQDFDHVKVCQKNREIDAKSKRKITKIVFNGDENRVKSDVELLVIKLRQEYKIKGKILDSRNDVFSSLDAYLNLTIQNHEQDLEFKAGRILTTSDGITPTIIMKKRINYLGNCLVKFFNFYDSDQFKDLVYEFKDHVNSLDFIYDERIHFTDVFNALLTINDNYLSIKDQLMPKFQKEILFQAKRLQLQNDQRRCVEYQKNEKLQILQRYSKEGQKTALNKNILEVIEQLRQVGMNRAAHNYSIDISQTMWFNNQPIQNSNLAEVLKNDKKQLIEMKDQIEACTVREGEIIMHDSRRIRKDWYKSQFNLEYQGVVTNQKKHKKEVKKSKTFVLVNDGPKEGRMFIIEDPTLEEQRRFTSDLANIAQSSDVAKQVNLSSLLSESVQPEETKGQSRLTQAVNISGYSKYINNTFVSKQEQSIICDVWPLTQVQVAQLEQFQPNTEKSSTKEDLLKAVNVRFAEDSKILECWKHRESNINSYLSNLSILSAHTGLQLLNWKEKSGTLFFSKDPVDHKLTGVYEVHTQFPTLARAQYVIREWVYVSQGK